MENPDNKYIIGLGPQGRDEFRKDWRHMPPQPGMLRFVQRTDTTHPTHPVTKRILQQYQWCSELSAFDWYDLPIVTSE